MTGVQTCALPIFVRDLERVRPVEKKLILALARAVKKHDEFLATLGMEKDGE